MGQPVVHFEINGTDGERLHSYFSELFGWEVNADNPMNYGLVDREQNLSAEGVGIGGGIMGMPSVPGYVTFYVEVPDVEAALAQAESLGGTRVMGPESPQEGLVIGMFNDPEGHLIGVIEPAG